MCCLTVQGGQHFFFLLLDTSQAAGNESFSFSSSGSWLPSQILSVCDGNAVVMPASTVITACKRERGWETTELIGETWHKNQPITSLARFFFPLCLSQVVHTDMPVKAATFPRRSFQSHNPSKEVQQRCKKLAAWQCRRAREIISVQLSEQLGNFFFCFFYLSDRRYAFLFFFSFPSNTQCLASHQVIEHPKKKKGCRGKRHHFVMGHPPTHRTRTHSHMHTKKKKFLQQVSKIKALVRRVTFIQ